jgi:uncharacterized protein
MSKHTNRLINETSPYLLQHAHNPVDWYPWSEEALERAKTEDKPILVSIGYAACHWCHVMERESFEDEATAAIMNEHFVNIKIDREERPDLDHVYMDAVQAMAGNGGWPLNVFLMPGGKPFYGGTYFPPKRAFNRPSWQEILLSVHDAYTNRKHELESQAENLTAHLTQANAFGNTTSKDQFTDADLELIAANILKQADTIHGGFGAAPKFPQTFTIQYLLRHYYFTKDEGCLSQALLSLDKMIYGGIYDQLGGGFARYSTDAEWLAPHFEKMLYDNALLIMTISEAYQLTRKELYKETIEHTLEFIGRELMSNEMGFYSALDADSEGVEGKFYTWSKAEIDNVLGDDAKLFNQFYDVSESGNWEHTNILRVKQPLENFAVTQNIGLTELKEKFETNRKTLLSEREKRIRPQLDDKVLLGWNALMNIAYCKAFAATSIENYRQTSIKNIQFLEEKFFVNATWHHTYKEQARIPAFLDDLAYLAYAYIHLQEITADGNYLIKAKQLVELIISEYSDESQALFYYTGEGQPDIIIRKKEIYDGAVPSGNAVMAMVLSYLSKTFDLPEWEERAVSITNLLRQLVTKYPTSFGLWAQQAQILVNGINEIAVTGENSDKFLSEILQYYIPNKLLQGTGKNDENFPLLKGRASDETRIYLCKNYVCLQPFVTVEAMMESINRAQISKP